MKSVPQKSPNSFHCIDALEVSLSIEKQGFVYYDKAAKSAVDPRVRAIFLRLANEEKEHIQSLQNKARFLQPALRSKAVPRESRAENFIKNELIGKVFPVPTDDKNEACAVENDLEALNIGIAAEKRSIEVLSQLAVDEKKIDVRMIFNHLLIEERKHLADLEELKKTLGKK